MKRIVALASLYEPMEFLENRIRNLNDCDMSSTLVYWSDCSTVETWADVEKIVRSQCRFDYLLDHHPERKTLYWTWNWIVGKARSEGVVEYFCAANVDDIAHPAYFRTMGALLDHRKDLQIAGCAWLNTDVKGQLWPPPKIIGTQNVDADTSMGHFAMWRASLHDVVGEFNPLMVAAGDLEFWRRTKKICGREALGATQELLACYLYHGKNLWYTAKGPNGENGADWDHNTFIHGIY